MSATQVKYALKRLDDIYCDKIKVAEVESEKKGTTGLPIEDLVAGIKSGKIKARKSSDKIAYSRGYLYSPDVHKVFDLSTVLPEPDKGEFGKLKKKMEKEYLRIKDELVLGDNEKALAMIKDFETKEY